MATPDDCWYLAVADLLALHEEIIDEHDASEPGVRDEAQLEFALEHVEFGRFGDAPASTHQKAVRLLRLLAANHPFVDGNKRTALNATATFLAVNGHRFDYGHDVRVILKLLGVREDLLDRDAAVEYLAEQTTTDPTTTDPTATIADSPDATSDAPSREALLEIARQDRDEHRDVYDALADE